ncbi:6166_t:CDS:2, partial [Dentiscutata heterogama]
PRKSILEKLRKLVRLNHLQFPKEPIDETSYVFDIKLHKPKNTNDLQEQRLRAMTFVIKTFFLNFYSGTLELFQGVQLFIPGYTPVIPAGLIINPEASFDIDLYEIQQEVLESQND